MAKYVFLVLIFMVSSSIAYYYSDDQLVDKCGLINLLNYKQDFPIIRKKLEKYPRLFTRVNVVLADIMYDLGNNDVKYKDLISAITDYLYNHNICQGTEPYLVLSYIDYVLYERYLALTYKSNGIERLLHILNINN